MHIPGRTFPVEELYIETAIAATAHVIKPGAEWARRLAPGESCILCTSMHGKVGSCGLTRLFLDAKQVAIR